MKRYWTVLIISILAAFCLVACGEETVPKEEQLEVLDPLKGSTLEKTHAIDDFKLVTTYDTGNYNLSRWRITDSKNINMSAQVQGLPEGATVLIEHVHIDMSLKSTNPQLDGLSQDSMDDSFHGSSQDGFWVSEKYPYQNIFAIEGFSKDLIDGWGFVTSDYGTYSLESERLTEKNLILKGDVYANKMQVVYDLLIKYANENLYHVVSISDEFLIPVKYEAPKTEKDDSQNNE